NDHEVVRALFDKFTKPPNSRAQNGKKELFNEIRRELLIHSQMEQEIFYPALSGTSSAQAAQLVAQAEQEHEAIEKLMQELNTMAGTEKNFETKMTQLMDHVVQ